MPADRAQFPLSPSTWPLPDDDVLRALQDAYADGSWGKYHGGSVERLEDRLRIYHELEFAIACGSGTYSVELALRALKIGPGDEVLMAAYDYPGNFLNIHAVGAMPVLIDVDRNNWNLDPAQLEAAIVKATKAIIASHLHGGVVPMRAVREIADKHGLSVIEDVAQMPGAIVQGRKAGTWGDVAILSFGGSKLLTAGRGGALLTRRADVHQRARVALERGNVVCPLSELQAAVLLPQLEKLDARNRVRAENVCLLTEHLHEVPGVSPFVNGLDDTQPGYYKLGLQFDAARFGTSRERFLAAMRAEGVAVNEGFKALHVGRSPTRYRANRNLSESTRAHSGTVVLHHPVLLEPTAAIMEIVTAMKKVRGSAGSM